MNATRFFSRVLVAFVTLFLVAGLAMGQNLNLKGAGSTNLGGTWNVKGNISTSGVTGTVANTFTGTVSLSGTGATLFQTIASGGGTFAERALVFANLDAGTSGATAKAIVQGGIVTVNTAFVQNTGATPGAGQSYSVGTNTLNFDGATTLTGGVFSAPSGSTVNYASGGASQTVLAATYGGTLALSGASIKHMGSGGVSAATMTHASGDIAVDNNLTITGSSTTTLLGVAVSTGALANSGSGNLQITTLTNNTGTINASGATASIEFLQTGTPVPDNGTITTATGTLLFDGDVTLGNSNSLTVTGAGTAKFSKGVAFGTTPTFTFAANSTVEYNGTSAQNIAAPSAGSYSKLTLTGNNVKTTYGSFGGLNTLTINGTTTLDMAGSTIGSVSTYAINESTTDSTTWATVKFSGASNGQAIPQGIVDYYGTGGQTIATGSYNMLKLSGSGNKDVADGTTVTTTGSLIASAGNLRVGVAAAATLNVTWTLDLSGSLANFTASNIVIGGDFNVNGALTNNGTIQVGN